MNSQATHEVNMIVFGAPKRAPPKRWKEPPSPAAQRKFSSSILLGAIWPLTWTKITPNRSAYSPALRGILDLYLVCLCCAEVREGYTNSYVYPTLILTDKHV